MDNLLEFEIIDTDSNEYGTVVYFELYFGGVRLSNPENDDTCQCMRSEDFSEFSKMKWIKLRKKR